MAKDHNVVSTSTASISVGGLPIPMYRAELRAIEFEYWRQRRKPKRELRAASFWHTRGALERLTRIDRKYGIRPGDVRVYSITAFLDEQRALEDEWNALKDDLKEGDAAVTEARRIGATPSQLHGCRLIDCRGRHFPGLYPAPTADRVGSIPKLWAYANFIASIVSIDIKFCSSTAGRNVVANERLEEVFSLLTRLRVDWAEQVPYPRFGAIQARDKLIQIAWRLETEERAALLEELGGEGFARCFPSLVTDAKEETALQQTGRKPRVPADEANLRIAQYLKKNPRPKNIVEVASATGVSTGAVSKSQAWKLYMDTSKRSNGRTPKMRPLAERQSACLVARDPTPHDAPEMRELREQLYLENSPPNAKAAYRKMGKADQDAELWVFERGETLPSL